MNLKKTLFFGFFIGLICVSCTTSKLRDIQPGEQPPIDSDEAGLWMYMERIEESLKRSGRIETDPELNSYIRGVICKLAPDYCADMRLYIVRTPYFNASMAPNGFMQVWTGLLLRAQNEAQLAYVLGHEISHFARRHSVQQWRAILNTSSAITFLRIAAGLAGIGYAGDLTQLVALAGIMSFSRDHEREADSLGFELIAQAGYDPYEASKVWEALMEERKAADDPGQLIFFATHPSTEERIEVLKSRADVIAAEGKQGVKYEKEYLSAIRPFRVRLLQEDLQKRQFAATQVVLDHLFETGDNLGELYFFQGELYRSRAEEDDVNKAIACYERALNHAGAPSKTYRSLGLLYWKNRLLKDARHSFERYLKLEPGAPDRRMIKAYLKEME